MGLRVSFGVHFAQVRNGTLRPFNARRTFRFVAPSYLAAIHVLFCEGVDEGRDKKTVILEPIGFGSAQGP